MFSYEVGNKNYNLRKEILLNGTKKHVVFYDNKLVNNFFHSDTWNVDATYKTVPKFGRKFQLLTIMGHKQGKVKIVY